MARSGQFHFGGADAVPSGEGDAGVVFGRETLAAVGERDDDRVRVGDPRPALDAALPAGDNAPGDTTGLVPTLGWGMVIVGLAGLGVWFGLMAALTLVNYGYPIAQLMALKETNVPAVYVGASR